MFIILKLISLPDYIREKKLVSLRNILALTQITNQAILNITYVL